MVRPRRPSLVEDIASQPGFESSSSQENSKFGALFADSYLLQKLEALSVELQKNKDNVEMPKYDLSSQPTSKSSVDDNDPYITYRKYIQQLDDSIEGFQKVVQKTEEVNGKLGDGLDQFVNISKRADGFVDETREIHEKRDKLEAQNRLVPEQLKYFEALDPIIRRLNHATSPSIVRKESFKNMMVKIDNSLEYLHEHSDFKEAETYRIKFKQCLIRCCDLIVHHLNSIVNRICTEITDGLQNNKEISETTREVLLYNKFASISEEYTSEIKCIIERRHMSTYTRYRDELDSLLNECYNHYFQARKSLLDSIIKNKLNEIYKSEEHIQTRKFISAEKDFFQQLAENEYHLFVKFFPGPESKERGNKWLIQLCDPFYDSVKAKLLRENDILTIRDCILLFTQYYEFEEDYEEYENIFKDVYYDKLFEPVLQKLQSRLIFRAQKYIDEAIVKYKPPKGAPMITNRKTSAKLESEEEMVGIYIDDLKNSEVISLPETDSEEDATDIILSTYYIPIIRALALLSTIYEMINTVVFDDLAHHVVRDCLVSIGEAFNLLTSGDDVNLVEYSLSYLRNLLFLRDQLQTFNIQYTVNETFLDFSAVGSLFRRSSSNLVREELPKPDMGRRNSQRILSAARNLIPKLVVNTVDSGSELVEALRFAIRSFTDRASKILTEDYMKISDIEIEDILGDNVKLRTSIDTNLPRVVQLIHDYISDDEIVENLLDALKEAIQIQYQNYYDELNNLVENGKVENGKVLEVMYPDTFSEYLATSIKKEVEILENK
ncbi:Sec34-like family [Nakaseomyces glabratus]|nr:Sec34-like family [Nakaseomyces glabratus]KAH7590454.1 Sec34-like family [Nakaseomyces glabratus]KAI8396164.1 Sec34-like family [Nakaseomyces glabratus]